MGLLSSAWVHDLIQSYGLWALFIVIMLELREDRKRANIDASLRITLKIRDQTSPHTMPLSGLHKS